MKKITIPEKTFKDFRIIIAKGLKSKAVLLSDRELENYFF